MEWGNLERGNLLGQGENLSSVGRRERENMSVSRWRAVVWGVGLSQIWSQLANRGSFFEKFAN